MLLKSKFGEEVDIPDKDVQTALNSGYTRVDQSNLQGTLPAAGSSPIVTQPGQDRTLGGGTGSIAAFKSVLKDVARQSYGAPTVSSVVERYRQSGVSLTDPTAISTAVGTEGSRTGQSVGEIYKSTIDLINEQEKRNQEYVSAVMQGLPKSFLGQMSGAEYEELKSGKVSPELKIKIAQAAALEGKDNKFQFVSQTENQPGGSFDPSTGKFTPYQPTSGPTVQPDAVLKFEDGVKGGQCGVFARKIIGDLPLMGDTIETKKKMIDANGIGVAQWKLDPQIGDVLIFDTKRPAGHVAVINSINNDGTITLTESNWKNDEKVTNTRKVKINDPTIYGAYRSKAQQSPTREDSFDQFSEEQIALAALPSTLRNSLGERNQLLAGIRKGLAAGKTAYEVADILMGYKINKPDEFSESMRKYISVGDLSNTQISDMARLVNAGQKAEAIAKVENIIMLKAKASDPDGYIGETTAKTAVSRANAIQKELASLGTNSPVGVVKGTMTQWLGKLRGKEAQTVATQITNLVAEMRNRLSGTAVTASEATFLEPLIPSLNDSPENFMIKLNSLKSQPLNQLNNVRSSFELPALDERALLDRAQRIKAYETSSTLNNNMNKPQGDKPPLSSVGNRYVNPVSKHVR